MYALNADETARAEAIKKWSAKQDAGTEGRKNREVSGCNWTFPLESSKLPPAKPTKGQFFNWGVTGIEPLNQCAWLHSHKHGWEFMPHFF